MAEILKCFTEFDPRVFMDELKEGDMDWALTHVAPDATWRIPGDPKYGGATHEGLEGFRKFHQRCAKLAS